MSDPHPPLSVLILGFGAFGRLAARALAPYLAVAICDPGAAAQAEAAALGLPVVSPARAGASSSARCAAGAGAGSPPFCAACWGCG